MTESEPKHAGGQRILPWLLILPLLILTWPSPSLFAGDLLTTELTALGLGALAILPLSLWIAWHRPRPSAGSTLLFIALFLPANSGQATDSLELDRALVTFLVSFLVANASAQLQAAGRDVFVRALACLSALLLVPGLLDGAIGWGGVLGNSGELSAAALPGALCGMVLWTRSEGKWQWLGMVTVGLFLMHAVLAPVIAGLVALMVVLPVAIFCMRGAGSTFVAKSLGMLMLVVGGLGWIGFSGGNEPEPQAQAEVATDEASAAEDHFGGFEVRRRIWGSSLGLFMEAPVLGIGLGQYSARFPEFRDEQERKLSNRNHQAPWTTEVEHPHNDWLLPWIEGGLVSGIAWCVFLYLAMKAAVHSLGRARTTTVALGAAALGGLLAAGLNGPLLFNPTASIAFFAVFGAVLGPGKPVPSELKRRMPFGPLLTLGMVLLLMLNIPRALHFVQHGQELSTMASSSTDTERDEAILKAAEILEDSVIARSLAARVLEERDGDLEGALAHWDRVLQLRPLRFEATMQRGVLLARQGERAQAQQAFDRALELDETHPGLLRNRVLLAAESADLELALEEIKRLTNFGAVDTSWIMKLGCEAALRGHITTAMGLLARADARFVITTPEHAYALEKVYRRNGESLAADGFKALANILWARSHAKNTDWDNARRSYFQALRIQRDYVKPKGSTSIRVEHACAIWHKGDKNQAAESLTDLDLSELNWALLPSWCQEPLLNLIGPPAER